MHDSKEMEVGILVDLHTWKYWIIDGRERMVDVKFNREAYMHFLSANKNQLMFMHNHPGTGTFSGKDFKFFCTHDEMFLMTVVGNDGSVYSLMKSAYFNNMVLQEYLRIAEDYYNNGYTISNGTLAMREVLKKAEEYGLEYKKGGHK